MLIYFNKQITRVIITGMSVTELLCLYSTHATARELFQLQRESEFLDTNKRLFTSIISNLK